MTHELGPLTQELFRIARDRHDDRQLAAKICRACVACLDVHGAAISLLTATTSRTTLSATDPTAATLEDLQFTLGEGACIEAATSGRPVLVSDIHDHVLTTRWPVFAGAVAEQTRARALFALPLQLGTIDLGVLDLYRDTPGPLREQDLRDAVAAADTATLMLLAAPVHASEAEAAGHPITDGHSTGKQRPVGWHPTRTAGASRSITTTVTGWTRRGCAHRGGTGCGTTSPRYTRPPG